MRAAAAGRRKMGVRCQYAVRFPVWLGMRVPARQWRHLGITQGGQSVWQRGRKSAQTGAAEFGQAVSLHDRLYSKLVPTPDRRAAFCFLAKWHGSAEAFTLTASGAGCQMRSVEMKPVQALTLLPGTEAGKR